MKKICVYISGISTGGITSFAVNLINYIVTDPQNDVTVLYRSGEPERIAEISQNVHLKKVNIRSQRSIGFVIYALFKGRIWDVLRIVFRNRNRNINKRAPTKCIQRIEDLCAKRSGKFEERFDIAISTSEFFSNAYVHENINAAKKIGWIHPDLSTLEIDEKLMLENLIGFDKICVVSESCRKSFVAKFPMLESKTLVIENITPQSTLEKKAGMVCDPMPVSERGINIVSVCRLDNSSKRIDRMIRLAAYLKSKNIDFSWNVVGGGHDYAFLYKLAEEIGVLDVFHFLGPKTNPYPYVKKSDLFVLTSQYEGKPIAVDEALALKVPCIVTNYVSAKKQINEKYGAVVDNEDDLINEQFLRLLSPENIAKWKRNLADFRMDYSEIYQKINSLLEI